MTQMYKVIFFMRDLFNGYVYPFHETNDKLIESARADIFKHNDCTRKHFRV